MPATVTRGKTFGATETVTNTKLHQLVDSATIADIDQTNIASGYGLAIRSTSAPSDTDALWIDTNSTPPIVRHYNGSAWIASANFAVLTNKSGGTRSAGDVVVVDTTTASAFTTNTAGASLLAPMVVMESIANNADGLVAVTGALVPNIAVDGTTAKGDYLKTSTSAGQATPSATIVAGVFAIALSSRSGAGALSSALLIGLQGTAFTPSAANAIAGSTVQVVGNVTSAVATGTTAVPDDDTAPQDSEGVLALTQAITPNSASNKYKIRVGISFAHTVPNQAVAISVFSDQDGTANPITGGTIQHWIDTDQTSNQQYVSFEVRGTFSNGNAHSFTVRLNGPTGATLTINGTAGSRKMGGFMDTYIIIEEEKV